MITKKYSKTQIIPEPQIRCVKLTSIYTACVIFLPNPMFDHLLKSSQGGDSDKWLNIEFGERNGHYRNIHLIWSPVIHQNKI